jgi:hypothetical protein
MHKKLNVDAEKPIKVETVLEKQLYRWAVIGGLSAFGGLILGIVGTIFDLKKLFELTQGYLIGVLLVSASALLLVVAGWLNLKAARKWHEASSGQLLGAPTVTTRVLEGEDVAFGIGHKVRVKAHLTSQEKEAGPGWTPQMDLCLGRESVVKFISKNGTVVLADFPNYLFLKEWLEPLNQSVASY